LMSQAALSTAFARDNLSMYNISIGICEEGGMNM
jgi:hypothetical protein